MIFYDVYAIMEEMSQQQPKSERLIERTHHSPELYNAAFGRIARVPTVQNILDIGAGDSDYAISQTRAGKRVTRIDRDYARVEPKGSDWLAGDITKGIEIPDHIADASVSAFLMQHLSQEAQSQAIKEMLRVTRQYDEEEHNGVIGLYPVYKPDALEASLKQAGFYDKVGLSTDYLAFDRVPLHERRLVYPTLIMPNWADLTPDEQNRLVEAIVESQAFYRTRTVADMCRQLAMRARGDTRVA